MQAIETAAPVHRASLLGQPLPVNAAYVCWQLAGQEELNSILGMLASMLQVPQLRSGFMAALTQLGTQSAATTLTALVQVFH